MIQFFYEGDDRVVQKTLWKLFENTGSIQAYLYYKGIERAVASKVQEDIKGSEKQAFLR
ncbi:MAG: YqzL family protein [Geosporobacter ferrireducens]|nr:YqzL family protein [Geosporobacter ferrireducens]